MSSSRISADSLIRPATESSPEKEPHAENCGHDVYCQQLEPFQKKKFDLRCADCGSFVAKGTDLRIVKARCAENKDWVQWLRIVVDQEFPSRISVHPHWESGLIGWTMYHKLEVIKEKKILCKSCGNDWGVRVRIRDKLFYLLKIVTLQVIVDGEAKQFEHWKEARYFMQSLSDSQLMTFGENVSADDSNLPVV